jgi:hypothetical protein
LLPPRQLCSCFGGRPCDPNGPGGSQAGGSRMWIVEHLTGNILGNNVFKPLKDTGFLNITS